MFPAILNDFENIVYFKTYNQKAHATKIIIKVSLTQQINRKV